MGPIEQIESMRLVGDRDSLVKKFGVKTVRHLEVMFIDYFGVHSVEICLYHMRIRIDETLSFSVAFTSPKKAAVALRAVEKMIKDLKE